MSSNLLDVTFMSQFQIKKDQEAGAYAAVKELNDSLGEGTDDTLTDELDAWGFENIVPTEEWCVEYMSWVGTKWVEHYQLFKALAPFVDGEVDILVIPESGWPELCEIKDGKAYVTILTKGEEIIEL